MHRHPPAPTPELIAAYRSARYRVSTPEGDVLLRVDAVNPCVAALLAQANAPWAVFVTAHQPFSHPVSADENAARQAELLAWAIARGPNEASTFVVVRVVVDRAKYPWLSVVGVDPFTKAELVRVPARMIDATYDVRMPRGTIADHPNTEFRFYASEGDARAGAPALVVYYHGVPDTAPEFAEAGKLSQYLGDRLAKLK